MIPIITLKNIKASYQEDNLVLKDVSLTINKGDYTCIIGHNGSGKSTLTKVIIGLLGVLEGEVLVDGIELNEKNIYNIRKKVGVIFQNPDNQFIGSTVRDDIAFGLENHCVDPKEMDDIIEKYAAKVKMTKFLDSEPQKLSGGQKQRVAIAGVLAMHPDIIIMDEATSMLDPKGKAEIKELVALINEQNDVSIVSITHDIEEAARADRIIVMHQGEVYKVGTPQEIFTNHEELASLGLDVPFALKVSLALQKQGINIPSCLTMDEMEANLCKLK